MAVLNQDIEWKQIAADPAIRDAFLKPPVKTLLEPATMLCRFITTVSKSELKEWEKGEFKGRWWMEWKSAIAEINRWRALHASPKDVIRGRMAVTTQMSPKLDSMLQIILTKPAYAWKGIARHQDDPLQRVTYLGGGEQIFLPNLASDEVGFSSKVAYIHCFTAIESLG